jgi:hypothetical protein
VIFFEFVGNFFVMLYVWKDSKKWVVLFQNLCGVRQSSFGTEASKNAILHSPSLKELNLRNLWNAIYRKEINLILIEKPQLRVLWEANEVL